MSTSDGFVISLTEQTAIQVILHIITIIALIGSAVITVYLLVLLIKLMRRGIKALELRNK